VIEVENLKRLGVGRYLSNNLWFIPDFYIYNSKTGELGLAFDEKIVPEATEFDLTRGNEKIIRKYRYLCRECGYKWLSGFNKGVCPSCGAKFKINRIRVHGKVTYYIDDDPVVGPICDEATYEKIKKQIMEKWKISL